MKRQIGLSSKIFWLFLAARIILFVSVPYDVIPGYGDYWNFYAQAKLGIPFINYWTEFPPLFPFLSKLIFLLVSGRETSYSYALAIIISLFQAGTLVLALKLAQAIYPKQDVTERIWVYFGLTLGLFYSWSYFDPIGVFLMLLGIHWIIRGNDKPAAFAIALGVLTKWFPIIVLPAAWKLLSKKRALIITVIVLGLVAFVWGILFLVSPQMTLASVSSQINKGSWETNWALIDNNLKTGNFGIQIDRLDPTTILSAVGNPAVIPSWVTLVLFGGFGLFLLIKTNLDTNLKLVSFVGLSQIILFLWSPGYSPQWVLYLLPFIIICLDKSETYLMSVIIVLINLLEWPLLLSRGNFGSLYYLIPLRTIIMVFLGFRLYINIFKPKYKPQRQ